MPQLNPEFFISQTFWLILSFVFLLTFLWKITLPKISNVLETRREKINSDLELAKKLQEDTEQIKKQIDDSLVKAEIEAKEKLKIAIKNHQDEVDKKISDLSAVLEKKMKKNSLQLLNAKNESLKEIQTKATELTSLSINKLVGIKIDDNLISDEIKKLSVNKDILN